MSSPNMKLLLEPVIASRQTLIGSRHEEAFRLFNGFTEGNPDLALDIYARTLVIHNYADIPSQNKETIDEIVSLLRDKFNWLQVGILKNRNHQMQEEKRGKIIFGEKPDRKIKEHGIWYAADLTMNRDASFYLDTRNLRKWLSEHMQGKSLLNTFAYTGSLGVAALAGGASRVVQTDLNRQFLNLAKDSYSFNGLPIQKQDFIAQDFFPVVSKFKSIKQSFDCVIIDPPFFSTTSKGKVDQENESARLINKVRPLINDHGYLIAINNGVFVSGKEYLQTLEELCKDGYLKIKELIPVPDDFTGYPNTRSNHHLITDPTPFNHSTKISILEVRKKSVTS
ncbi:MAG: class I SAM-dependent methyltransferase [Anaerolineales bacterium]